MSPPIILFYHGLLFFGEPPELSINAFDIVQEQMSSLQASGLIEEASEFYVGLNGGRETLEVARLVIPTKAKIILHGLESRAENLTIIALENWVRCHQGEAYILYQHSKGASHPKDSAYGNNVSAPWRRAMVEDLVVNWKACVDGLNCGADIVCSHWMWNMADGTQHIPCGNFLWVKKSFALKLPSMFLRDRIKQSGISAAESRYESEVYWGNGPRPVVFQMRPNGGGGVP